MLVNSEPVPHGHSSLSWSPEVCGSIWGEAWSMVFLGVVLGSRLLAAAVSSLSGVSGLPVRKAPWHRWNLLAKLSCTLGGLMQLRTSQLLLS